jgi:exodeoxyribonuclease-3
MQQGQVDVPVPEYEQYWNSAEKKGYSGTAVFVRKSVFGQGKTAPLTFPFSDTEGRVITLRFKDFTLVNVYTPNSQDGLKRLNYRMQWEDNFRDYVQHLAKEQPVVICGDMNVAHKEIDLRHPSANRKNPGFTDEERGKFTQLLEAGFADSFRVLYPDLTDAYSWWSYRANARANNTGWRIDYFVVSNPLVPKIADAKIHAGIFGSDHCPVELLLTV